MSKNVQVLDNQTLAEIAEFKQKLPSVIMKKMLEIVETISNNTYDPMFKPLTERMHIFLIQLQERDETLYVSDASKEFFQEALLQNHITFLPEE